MRNNEKLKKHIKIETTKLIVSTSFKYLISVVIVNLLNIGYFFCMLKFTKYDALEILAIFVLFVLMIDLLIISLLHEKINKTWKRNKKRIEILHRLYNRKQFRFYQ